VGNSINIGITGTGSLIGQAIIKCIKLSVLKSQINLIGFDYIPGSVGAYWCETNYLLPDIFKKDIKEEIWLSSLIEKVKLHKLNVLFIGIDFELPVFAKHRDYIEKETNCHVIVSNEKVIEIADDKYLTASFLKENNLYYPKSYTLLNYNSQLSFPMIIKPRIGFRSVGFNLIKTQEEFDRIMPTIKEPVIQECIGNIEDEYTCGILFLDNELKGSIALRRTLKEGNTSTAMYHKDTPQIIYDYLKDVSYKLRPYGVLNFQLRLDNEGLPKIFEINARHSGTTYMRALFGYNEIEYIICYCMNMPLPSLTNLKEGKVVRFFDEFFTNN
jgi:carbamoyl-phosphate synthase large subunit